MMQRLTRSHRNGGAPPQGVGTEQADAAAQTGRCARSIGIWWMLLLVAACGVLCVPQRAAATYVATLNVAGTIATLSDDNSTDTLTIISDGTYMYWNNNLNFDSGNGGNRRLPAQPGSVIRIILASGGAHTVILGTPAYPISTFAGTSIQTENNNQGIPSTGTLTLDDSGNTVASGIVVDPLNTAIQGLNTGNFTPNFAVHDFNRFTGGLLINPGTAGGGGNTVSIYSTDTGEPLTLNSIARDNVIIGNAGNAQSILAPVTLVNVPQRSPLTVDDSADVTPRTATITSTGITGLTPAAISYASDAVNNVTVSGGTGGNTFTVASTSPGVTTTLNSGASVDQVTVLTTAANSTFNLNGQNGIDNVTLGNAGSAQGIAGTVTVGSAGLFNNLTVDDSADTTPRTATVGIAGITGLAPATINYTFAETNSLTVKGGSGGNKFTVNSTVGSQPTTLNSGGGNDSVIVAATSANTPLNLNGGGGNDSVTLGGSGNTQGLTGTVNVSNPGGATKLTVDDAADATPRTIGLSGTAVSGLSSGALNYSSGISSLIVNGGTGGNTLTVSGTPGGTPCTLNSGTGNDIVNILATAANSMLNVNGGGGTDLVTIGNAGNAQGIAGAVTIGSVGGTTNLTVDDSADTGVRAAIVSPAQVSGLVSGSVTPGAGVTALLLKAGTANDSFNITPYATLPLNLDGGPGTNALLLSLTGVTAPQVNSTGAGAGNVSFGNRQTVTYTNIQSVGPNNQPPVNTLPAAALTTGENTSLTLSAAGGNALSVSDPDAGTSPLSVSLGVTNGTLTLNAAALGGLAFSNGNGTNNASMTFTGTIANINAALNGLVFTPTSLFSGNALLTITTNDGGNTGLGGAQSVTNTLTIAVTRAPRGLSISSVAQPEGNSSTSNMAFMVTLLPASTLPITVNYATADGTATAGSDYAATSGTLTFLAGQTTQTLNVPILGDTLHEADETFSVTLSNPTNAVLTVAGTVGTGTILNDDAAPGLSINDVNVPLAATDSTPFVFTVTLDAASALPVTVNYTTAPGTAMADEDYTTTAGTLTFTPGQTTQTITVPVLAEPSNEPSATFTVNLSGAVGATLTRAVGTGIIVNPTTPGLTLTITPSAFKQSAGESAALGTVSRNTDTSKPLVVTLSSSNPLRAIPALKTVTIPAGATSAEFVIDAIADTLAGTPPAVTITATTPGLAPVSATLTVTNTNRPALGLTVKPTRVLETAGATATIGTMTRNTPTTAPLKVTLTSSNTDRATVPASITIPARAMSVNFPIRVFHKTGADGPQRITITAKATGLDAATVGLTVLDSESHLTAGGRVTTAIAADAGTTGLNGTTNLSGPGGTPAKPILVGVPGTTVSLYSGAVLRDVVITDSTGNYSFTNLPAGSYTIKALRPGYTFAPAVRPLTLKTTNVTGLDFTGTARTTLSGRVSKRLGNGGHDTLTIRTVIARSGHGSFTTHTDSKGHYTFTGLPLDAYLLLPAVKGTFFTPAAQTVLLNAANPTVSAVDFEQAGTDTIAPTAKITGPLKGAYTVANQPTKVTGSAQDTGGAGVAYVTVALLRYVSATATAPTAFLNFNTGAFGAASALTEKLAAGTTTWTLRGLPALSAGFYGVRATATDGAGNVGVSTVVRYSVTAPAHAVAVPVSTLGLSTATASVASSSVTLRFLSALDADTASDAVNYTVTVNGQSVVAESAGYNATTHTVSLGLPAGALHSGDTVVVRWRGLLDAKGATLTGQTGLVAAR